ncbi:hypothetical protein LC607_29665 [Nostoc sp. CHAB 5824]|nr:hypothetical protein [Nostoc sp. CHAB 5824]
MNALDSITLRAILIAIQQMDGSLPVEVQNQLHLVGTSLPANISKLHIIAKSYAPLNVKYRIARLALQTNFAENLRFSAPEVHRSVKESDAEVLDFAATVLKALDSVSEAKRLTPESEVFRQLLAQLQQYKDIELREPSTSAQLPTSSTTIASTDKAMQAFLATVEEWADVYQRLAES